MNSGGRETRGRECSEAAVDFLAPSFPSAMQGRPLTSGPELFVGHPLDRRLTAQLDGKTITVRPVLPMDALAISDLLAGLSERSAYLRFHAPVRRLTQAQLTRLLDVDHRDAETLVAFDGRRMIGLGQYQRIGGARAELGLLVTDAWQRRGLGRLLARQLGLAAAQAGVVEFESHVLADNAGALALAKQLGGRTERTEAATRVVVHQLRAA